MAERVSVRIWCAEGSGRWYPVGRMTAVVRRGSVVPVRADEVQVGDLMALRAAEYDTVELVPVTKIENRRKA